MFDGTNDEAGGRGAARGALCIRKTATSGRAVRLREVVDEDTLSCLHPWLVAMLVGSGIQFVPSVPHSHRCARYILESLVYCAAALVCVERRHLSVHTARTRHIVWWGMGMPPPWHTSTVLLGRLESRTTCLWFWRNAAPRHLVDKKISQAGVSGSSYCFEEDHARGVKSKRL